MSLHPTTKRAAGKGFFDWNLGTITILDIKHMYLRAKGTPPNGLPKPYDFHNSQPSGTATDYARDETGGSWEDFYTNCYRSHPLYLTMPSFLVSIHLLCKRSRSRNSQRQFGSHH